MFQKLTDVLWKDTNLVNLTFSGELLKLRKPFVKSLKRIVFLPPSKTLFLGITFNWSFREIYFYIVRILKCNFRIVIFYCILGFLNVFFKIPYRIFIVY